MVSLRSRRLPLPALFLAATLVGCADRSADEILENATKLYSQFD